MNTINYQGREIPFESPLGIYMDGKITGRVHDAIIPKYHTLIPQALQGLKLEDVRTVMDDATRQLRDVALRDSEEVRQSLRNTINLTRLMLNQ